MKIDFTEMLLQQKKTDEMIIKGKIYNLQEKQLMAMSVEVNELFNEIRNFKYWSNKGTSNKEVLLDEFADVLHFWLSLANDICPKELKEIKALNNYINFEEVYFKLISYLIQIKSLVKEMKIFYMINFMETLLLLAIMLGFTEKEIEDAYYKKNKINWDRQKEGY